MRTRAIFMLMLAVVTGAASVAAAQVAPPVPPTPPAPPSAPAPPAPMVLPRIAVEMALDEARLASLDALRVLPDVQVITRDALDRARIARDDMRRDFNFDFNFDFQNDMQMFRTTESGGNYESGKNYLNRRQYDQAIARFDRVIAAKGANVDGSLYWKSFAQFKLGKSDDALATIAMLRKDHPQSPYNSDAKALEADVRKRAGQPVNPADVDDDELKILAIQGLMNTDSARAIPLLEGVLNGTNSLSVKKNALYTLAGSKDPKARQILLGYAKGGGNPDLQIEAIRYLAASRDRQSPNDKTTTSTELMQIYSATQSVEVKLAVIRALQSSGANVALTNIVNSSNSPVVVRQQALSGLSGQINPDELWSLYQKETNKELKMQMVSLFGSMDAADHLNRIITTEKDPEIRRRAVRSLGNRKAEKSGQMLVNMYAGEQDLETRRTIINSLASQNNAEGLVAIARKETTLELKKDIVRKLSDMAPKSKVAADYLMEIIK
ncbi:MAG TPA: HEAT repeat domain-containing protein [Vicinamibacterales bacterium]|nr:HEAT repeat domain-containing protein [Vicinamibacterales bacterium]